MLMGGALGLLVLVLAGAAVAGAWSALGGGRRRGAGGGGGGGQKRVGAWDDSMLLPSYQPAAPARRKGLLGMLGFGRKSKRGHDL
jgi:hypothetical protein